LIKQQKQEATMLKISVQSSPQSQRAVEQASKLDDDITTVPFLIFKIATHLYAVNLLQVREVRTISMMTRVAHAPPYVVGVTGIRGEIIPVINLKKRFNLDSHPNESDKGLVLISEMDARKVGIQVDSVQEVIEINMAVVQAVPRTTMAIDIQYLVGMAQVDGQVVLLVDLQKILQPEELHAVAMSVDEAALA
jgi:purine-binding chemotaxis protein CheW